MAIRALVSGQEGGQVYHKKASDKVYQLLLIDSNGGLQALTGGTVDILIYDTADRRNAHVVAAIAATLVTAANGKCTFALNPTNSNFGPGVYYLFARYTNGAVIKFSINYTMLVIG